MKQILISDETHRAAKAAAAGDGVPLFRWIESGIRKLCGLTGIAEVEPPHEMSLEDRLKASLVKKKKQ